MRPSFGLLPIAQRAQSSRGCIARMRDSVRPCTIAGHGGKKLAAKRVRDWPARRGLARLQKENGRVARGGAQPAKIARRMQPAFCRSHAEFETDDAPKHATDAL
eukprot:6214741-Pleurochrysis_carterae.AAC.6